jgi:hypothetical protein
VRLLVILAELHQPSSAKKQTDDFVEPDIELPESLLRPHLTKR